MQPQLCAAIVAVMQSARVESSSSTKRKQSSDLSSMSLDDLNRLLERKKHSRSNTRDFKWQTRLDNEISKIEEAIASK
jgi:hypothetical protein